MPIARLYSLWNLINYLWMAKLELCVKQSIPQRFESYYFIFHKLRFAVGWFSHITAMITDLFSDPSVLLNKDFFQSNYEY